MLVLACAFGVASAASAAGPLQIEIVSRALQPGEVVKVVVTCDCDAEPDGASASAFGRPIGLAPSPGVTGRWEGLAGIDLETEPGAYDIAAVVVGRDGAQIEAARRVDVQPKSFPTRRIRVSRKYVDPDPETLARMLDEAARLDVIYETSTPVQRRGRFVRPVPHPANSSFGSRSIVNGEPRSPHSGVDFRSPAGAPIAAPAGGVVVLADDLFFTGNTVVIDHGLGLYSILAHLSALAVEAGDRVEPGQDVGSVGSTGRATGPHLHWSVRLNGARVSPLSLLAIADR